MDIWLVLLFILLPMIGIVVSIVYWSLRNGIVPMPTASKVKNELLKTLPSGLQGKIYELGSGWGTLVIPLGKQYPHLTIIGFETSPIPYWISKIRLSLHSHVLLLKQNFWDVDLRDAGMIVCYLYPEAMRKLRTKFDNELPNNTWVISHTFAIPGWQPINILEVNDLYRTKIYVYRT